jgi:DNA primase
MDLKELLENNNVKIWTSGKNVSKGWIGLQCPFCGDTSNHLGIRLSDYSCRCWKCGKKSLVNVLMEILEIKYQDAKKTIGQLESPSESTTLQSVGKPKRMPGFEKCEKPGLPIPEEATDAFPRIHLDYLRGRGFNPFKLISKYQLKAVYTIGPYKFRVIIPIIYQNRPVTFVARDVTGESKLKYINASEKNFLNPKDYIYNIDTIPIGGDAVCVEGPMDVWKLGDGAISFLGINHSEKQLFYLLEKKIRNLHIFFDNDTAGKNAATKLAKVAAPFVRSINVVQITHLKDPGELTLEQGEIFMNTIRKSL